MRSLFDTLTLTVPTPTAVIVVDSEEVHLTCAIDAAVDAPSGVDIVFTVETSDDAGGPWTLVRVVRGVLQSGSTRLLCGRVQQYTRVIVTAVGLTGTQTATIEIGVHVGTSYLECAGIPYYSLLDGALSLSTAETCMRVLEGASEWCDGFLGRFYELPIIAFSGSLERAVAMIAAYDCLSITGFNPEVVQNQNYRLRYEDAIRWLEYVAKAGDAGIEGTPLEPEDGAGAWAWSLHSREPRGLRWV